MSVADLLKNVSVADLTVYARTMPSPDDFLLTKSVFAETKVQDVRWRIRQNKRRVNAASYRAYDTSVPFAKRQAESTQTEGTLPAQLLVGEMEQLLLDASRGADEDRLVESLYDDVERHVEAIRSRLELAAGSNYGRLPTTAGLGQSVAAADRSGCDPPTVKPPPTLNEPACAGTPGAAAGSAPTTGGTISRGRWARPESSPRRSPW
ncbi:major capsid protein [Streptomyces tubercidicus]|uniref:major capsid protein n=1 Tax=Streptomyces tubercidicus TaxID=47759 RepID=UPI0036912873